MGTTINICFVFDEKFADFFKVAILSIDQNTTSPLDVYIVDCGISEEKKQELIEFKDRLPNVRSITFGNPKLIDEIEQLGIPTCFSSAIFYRLQIPKIFTNIERVIYLDCDIIATGDITELWNEDLIDRPFGAVEEDKNFFNSKSKMAYKKSIDMPPDNKYYNSGVLLIDTRAFERSKIFERIINCISTTKIKLSCPEQDAMNICLKNNEHAVLLPKYNFCAFLPLAQKLFKKNLAPMVIHYAGNAPWHFNKTVVKIFQNLHLCKYSTNMISEFWKYSDKIDKDKFQSKNKKRTLKFFYKRLFQPIEHLAAKWIRDNVLRLLKIKNKIWNIKKK